MVMVNYVLWRPHKTFLANMKCPMGLLHVECRPRVVTTQLFLITSPECPLGPGPGEHVVCARVSSLLLSAEPASVSSEQRSRQL